MDILGKVCEFKVGYAPAVLHRGSWEAKVFHWHLGDPGRARHCPGRGEIFVKLAHSKPNQVNPFQREQCCSTAHDVVIALFPFRAQ